MCWGLEGLWGSRGRVGDMLTAAAARAWDALCGAQVGILGGGVHDAGVQG